MAVKQREVTAGSTGIRNLVREFKAGYTLAADGKAKFKVMGPDGEPVRLNDGSGRPLTLPNSPSEGSIQEAGRRLRELGVIESSNGKPARSTRSHERRDDLVVDRDRGQKAARERQERAAKLLRDYDKWIKKLGGWEARGLKADLVAVLAQRNPTIWKNFNSAQQTMYQWVSQGGTLSDNVYPAFEELHTLMMEAEDVRGVYVDLVRGARGIESTLGPVRLKDGEEWPYRVELVELDKLFNDYAYQRPVHDEFVRQLVLGFDERLVGVIDVSDRGDGKYAILDGQQRTETMKQVGKTKCYCAVYESMTIQDEAQFFFHKNKDRKGMSAYYGFRAKVLAGDEDSVAIDKILTEAGFKLGPVTDNDTAIGAVRAVTDVYAFESAVRGNCLPPTLRLIKEAFLGRKGSLDAEIIRGAGRFFRAFSDEDIQWDHWIEALTALGPLLVIGRARDFGGPTEQRGHGKSMASTLLEIHNTGLPMAKRLSLRAIELGDDSRQRRAKVGTLAA